MLTGEMIYKAFWMASLPENVHVTWISVSKQDKARYTAMADWLNVTVEIPALAHLHAQINKLTDTVLRIEQERDAFQQLAQAKGGSNA